MGDTHYVDQYIRNKRRSEAGTPSSSSYVHDSHHPTSSSSSYIPRSSAAAAATTTASPPVSGGGAGSGAYSGGGNNHNFAAGGRPSSSSSSSLLNHAAHQVLLSAAHRAQQEVDAVSSAAAELALREEQTERIERQYHLLSERVDTSALQVASAEDKVLNVTKMLKMLQQLSEDLEKSLRDEAGDLRGKIKRLERQLDIEKEAREKSSESMTQYIRDTVERALEKQSLALKADFQRQLDQFDVTVRGVSRTQETMGKEVEDVRRSAEKFGTVLREVEQFCHKFSEETRSSARALVDSRLEEFRIRNEGQQQRTDELRDKIEDVHDRLTEAVTSQHELRRSFEDIKRKNEPLKDWVEERVNLFRTEMRESIRVEAEKLTSQLHLSLANTNAVLELNESTISETRAELERLATTTQDHVKAAALQNAKASDSFQDLRELSAQSRDLLVNQLEATKEWASRNILRLKKHLDLAVSDMAATRQAQLEMQVNFQKLTQAHHDEKAALLQKLAQREREVALLNSAIDKEVSDVQNMMNSAHESMHHAQLKRQVRDEMRALAHM